ncbi:hypothetical protein GCM10010910_17670 [Microbacterium nanhaiense]|uniref:Uncharacterized protein n=1 Tax=Microbacterium nanhaiense TaxID=1301026 RepID=A0ABQ2N213_9MICO|nr:hypothetical protein GCM10010910_17670 [Microbacterium nanhaiense]
MSSPAEVTRTIDDVLAWAVSALRPNDAILIQAEADAGEEYFAFIDAVSIAHHTGPSLPRHLETAVQALAAQDARFRDDLRHATHPDRAAT